MYKRQSYRRGTPATGFAYYVPSQPTELCPSTGPELGGTAVFVTSSHLPRDTSGELIEGTALRIDWTHTMTTDADDCASIHLPALEEAYRLTVFGKLELDTVDRVDATAECSAGDLTITAAIRRLSEDETTPLYLAVPTIDAAHLNEVGLLGGGGEGVIAESSARDCGKVLSATVSGVEVSAEVVAAPPDCCNGSHYVAALFSSESGDGAPLLGYGPNTTRLPAFAGGAAREAIAFRTSRHPVASVGVRTSLNLSLIHI